MDSLAVGCSDTHTHTHTHTGTATWNKYSFTQINTGSQTVNINDYLTIAK